MRGNKEVIAILNEALKEELTAVNQYILHAEMCENWGYERLSEHIKKNAIGEMKHAEMLIERILFLDAMPKMAETLPLNIGDNVKSQLENDLKLELSAVTMYNNGIKKARERGDNASADLLEKLLKDEEEHVDWLESQLHMIKELGYENYLSQQMEEDE